MTSNVSVYFHQVTATVFTVQPLFSYFPAVACHTTHILEQNSSFASTEKWQLTQEAAKCRTFCEKTSEGMNNRGTACFGWSLHPPDFVTASKTAKKC